MPLEQVERIEANPNIMDGKPVIRGTRIPVTLALNKLSAGVSFDAMTYSDIQIIRICGGYPLLESASRID
jgi:uncharacterized protein (DUF433 family)